jgi:anti-sigma B factor antagonist
MELLEKIINNVLILELNGDLMGGTDSETFRQVVDKAILNENVNVVVDLGNVNWMNSSGLGMLISSLTSLRSSDGDLKLANLSERLKRPMKITKLDLVFEDYESVDNAVKSYSE